MQPSAVHRVMCPARISGPDQESALDDVVPFDLQRMFLGDAPPLFFLEIAFRTVLILLWTAALLRWIGGRSISQLSIIEFLLVIALGSAVGDAMFYPEVPLLHAMLVILVVILADKAMDLAMRRSPRAKEIIDGRPVEVLRNGRILTGGLTDRGIGPTELAEMLRTHRVENLGQVRLAYLEPSGVVSVFPARDPRPGLCIVPPPDIDAPAPLTAGDTPCCITCGSQARQADGCCGDCGGDGWTAAKACEPL